MTRAGRVEGPSSAARATACSHSTRLEATLGIAPAASSRSGSGNAGTGPPPTGMCAPAGADPVRIAVACARCRRVLMIDQAAAS